MTCDDTSVNAHLLLASLHRRSSAYSFPACYALYQEDPWEYVPSSLLPVYHHPQTSTSVMSSELGQTISQSSKHIAQHDAQERWKQALENYREETGKDLLEHPFARDFLSQSSTAEVMARLKEFMAVRARGHKILGVLKSIVSVVLRFIDAGAESAAVRTPSYCAE